MNDRPTRDDIADAAIRLYGAWDALRDLEPEEMLARCGDNIQTVLDTVERYFGEGE